MLRIILLIFTLAIGSSCSKKGDTSSLLSAAQGNNQSLSDINFSGLESISNITSSRVELNWTDKAGVALYLIYDVSSGTPVFLSSVSAPASTTSVSGLTKATTYTFRVRMLDTSGLYDENTSDLSATTTGFSNTHSMQLGSGTHLDTGVTTDLSGSGDFSFSAWFKGTDAGYLISQSHLVSYSSDFIIGGTGASLFWMRSVTLGTKSDIEDGNWHHIAFVWNSTTEKYKGYLDGVLLGESATVTGYGGIGTPVIIGSRGDATSAYSDGLVDEVALYNRALSDADVTTLYNGGVASTPSSTDLVSWWRMGDDASDDHTTIIDQEAVSDITASGMSPASLVEDAPN